ncbi:SusC/RagA family TonB-linked outer membrane protein [Prevotella sp. E13-17]|uniref:SusC/RagA family TonB-linked outer membrane protein n=1 Tax=Prevotella sp. E13-17 TaxID=2913616 RepID=UPI001ED9F1D4|nr:SusC/RagA family TonB-linked outer membrane protein [Prevotella sp. E13-17]UKK51482.1 SusC/RagA family TonB-linked outer membrane protein [Prevotella sp. E13-17]
MNRKNIFVLSLLAGLSLPAAAQKDSIAQKGNTFVQQSIDVGAEKTFSREQSTSSASVITRDNVDKRSAKNIGNSILGQGNGLVSLDGTGSYFAKNPTFYVRGLQSLSTSTPLILVDGVEREISVVTPEDVENVTILKDAAATALYGYKGINGAILITTKRGKYNSNEMSVHYDHLINYQTDRPKFIDGPTYAAAMNEALFNEGKGEYARYSQEAMAAFQNGQYPYQYPNVNWVDETFRHHGVTNKVGIDFTGGGERFRYYTALNLLSDKGFIKTPDATSGYSTQDKYVRGNLRINLDIDLTPTTMLKANISGLLSENSQPGNEATPWSNIYNLPSAAFPIKSETGDWGGNSTWAGTLNPVALTTDAAYFKIHERGLFADITLTQDLSSWVKGLGFFLKLGYDTYSTLYENHSKGYVYGSYPVTGWNAGEPVLGDYFTGGERTEMAQVAATRAFARRLTAAGGVNFDRTFDDHYVYSQLKWDYDYQHLNGNNNIIYRQNYSWWSHYAYKQKYIAELALSYSGSSRLAPNTKWAFAPTLSAAWVISKENFMKDIKWIDFLKLRASIGKLNADYLPGDNIWTYYTQSYSISGASAYYFVDATAAQDLYGTTTLGTMATVNPSHEKATKFNVGFDATLFKGLNVEFDYFFNHRYDIWCSGAGAYTALIGFGTPYVNQGVVNQHGFDASIDYTHQFGDVTLNIGGNMTLAKSKIKDMAEELRAYDNLVQTGNPLNSIYGLVSEGIFTSQEEIDAAPRQTFTTVRPGDIRYKDVNGDNVIDANDKVRMGYSVTAPELYYSFHLGAEYKNFGLDMMFQGVGRFSAMLNTTGYYWGLVGNSSLAQQVYDNRWSQENNNANAKYPRLSSESNANNYQTSDFWLRDRSYLKLRNIEFYYNVPKQLLAKTKYINGAKVYLRGVDLFTFDHLDEVDAAAYSATTPLTRSVAFGVSVTL